MQTILPVDQLVGTTLGDYRIERLLNHGKLGTAYLARKRGQDLSVMITLFPLPETFSDRARKAFGARFLQESKKLIHLQHPQLLPIYTYGQYASNPYLVSAFVKGRSLAQILKQQPRFTLQQTAHVLRQMAGVLDYLHQHQVLHGLLNPTSILVDTNQTVLLAGVGLRNIVEMYGIEVGNHPYAHLYSVAETFLGAPEYLAPECVGTNPLNASADLYSLAVIVFEMLTGVCPFTGKDQVEVVLQRLQQPVPSLHSVSADVPVELDMVMQKALHRNPAQRFLSAGEMASAFEHIVHVVTTNQQSHSAGQPAMQETFETTLPPTVNWFDSDLSVELPGQGIPPVTMGYLSSIGPRSAGRIPAQQGQTPARNQQSVAAKQEGDQQAEIYGSGDPFELWSASSARMAAQTPDTRTQKKKKKDTPVSSTKETKKQKPTNPSRRKAVALLATGGVAVVGLGLGGAAFVHRLPFGPALQATTQQQQAATTKKATTTTTTNKKTTTKQATGKTQPAATTQQHTGTVIGKTTQANNSAIVFTNPADGNQSLLIRLPNGNFVAGERACTHQGVPVNYHPDTHTLVCPLHGAIFDPTNNFNVLQGPAQTPLKAVAIHVNGDGTITV